MSRKNNRKQHFNKRSGPPQTSDFPVPLVMWDFGDGFAICLFVCKTDFRSKITCREPEKDSVIRNAAQVVNWSVSIN